MTIRILGLDPGLRCTGWGIIDVLGNSMKHVDHGVIKSTSDIPLPIRLTELSKALNEILDKFAPDEAAVEETFVNKNPTSTLKLGMARGVILETPARFGLPVAEYSANKVKKTVVGVGHADKDQVAMMVRTLLPAAGDVKQDAADALAIAICHAQYRTTELKMMGA